MQVWLGRDQQPTGFPGLLRCFLQWVVLRGLAQTSAGAHEPVPLVLGNRNIHVFRSALGVFTPAERAEGDRADLAAFPVAGDSASDHEDAAWRPAPAVVLQGLKR
jgi:hypothetical protein